ncbi:MAG: polysaccharide deacetylase family protein [Cytophagaceae bacterium]
MKKLILILVAVLPGFAHDGLAQVGKICNWDNGRKAAVVLTFDDWTPGQYPVVVPELRNRNINATFNIILNDVAAWNHDWPTVVTTASDGNEIANHTLDHPSLDTVPSSKLHTEIRDVKTTIDIHITSQKVLTFAYPLGVGAGNTAKEKEIRDSIKACGHIAARSVNPSSFNYTYNFAPTDDDYYKILTYAMNGSVSTSTFYGQIQNIKNGGGLLTYLYHSVDTHTGTYGDNWYARVIQDSLQKQLDTLVSQKNVVWITTFAQAIKYHKEKNCAALSQIQAPDGSTWIVNLTDTLSNNAIYNQPLSLKLKMNGVNYNLITQNGNNLAIDSIYSDTIMFRAVPDAGQITLTANATGLSSALSDQDIRINPVPSSGLIYISTENLLKDAEIVLFDAMGKEVYSMPDYNGSKNFLVDLSTQTPGVYFLKIRQGNALIIKKIILI